MKRYYIKALSLAAWLIANDVPLLSEEKTDRGYYLFWFEDNDNLHKLVDAFYNDNKLQDFVKAQIKLKKIIHPKANEQSLKTDEIS